MAVYTQDGMAEIVSFDWDAANLGHILRHAVTPFEVEEVAVRPHVTIPAKTMGGEERWKLFGKTVSNRYLVVVFTIRKKQFRTVTAYEMNIAERRKYAPQID
jgi:uncharacterized DUF497 family protein